MVKSYLKLILSMLIWGTIALFVRNIPYSSSFIVLLRVVFGLIFLLTVSAIKKTKLNVEAMKKNAPKLLISGVIMGFNWVALFESYRYVNVSIATLCYYCAPVFVIIGSAVFFKEKLRPVKIVGIIGALAGMVIITNVVIDGTDPIKGMLFGLASAFMYASCILLNKTFKGMDGLETTVGQLLGAGVIILPYSLLTHTGAWAVPDLKAVICILAVGFIHTGFALYIYFSAIRELPSQSVALCSYIDPVSAIIFASIFLNETLTGVQIIGAVLIIGSAAFGELCGREKSPRKVS